MVVDYETSGGMIETITDEEYMKIKSASTVANIPHTSSAHSCNCIGPQNGEPKCPCMMKSIIQRDGRWIELERDLGPVQPSVNEYKKYSITC